MNASFRWYPPVRRSGARGCSVCATGYSAAPSALKRRISGNSAAGQLAEGGLQGSEPRLEVSPLVDALFIYGLAYLLGARRAHAALGLVELEAGRLEIESDEIEDPPHLGFEILDQFLVLDTQD